jgi:hypothetical protein
MSSTSKTVKFQGSFSVVDASGVSSPHKIIKDLDETVAQVQTGDPLCIPASQLDFQIPFGGITVGKRVYLSTDQEVTLKVNNIGDVGFPWMGTGVLPSGTGITDLYVTTGPNATNVAVVVAGN